METVLGSEALFRSHTVIYAGNVIGNSFQTGNKVNIRELNRIGDNVSVGSLSVIEHHVEIGNNVRIHSQAYRWDLWATAYWLHGGCGDDGFLDFRSCLISLGKGLYLQILEDPDSLADLAGRFDIPYMQAEGFQYVASKVYREKTGQSIPEREADEGAPPEPAGERIDHDDAEVMRRRFPKLVARYPEMGD